jgi:site-specific DNA-methyltransferase (adenine-specific)
MKPLTINKNGVVISGHRRYQVALLLGWPKVPVIIETFTSPEAEMERLLRENENRGKTPEQQIREGMTWEPIERTKANDRQRSGVNLQENFPEGGQSRDIIARRVGLGSGKNYEKGKAVVIRIDKELGNSDLFHYGEILRTQLNGHSITAAWNTLDNIEKAEKKSKQEAKKKEEDRLQKQEEARQRYLEAVKKAEHCTLYHCSVADLSRYIQPDCIDAIICDPPYPQEFLPVYSDLARFADYALKPGGSLVVMTGQSYLQEVMERLASTGLAYQWTCAYLTPGGQSPQLWTRNVNTFWKPILWYVKGEYTGEWIGDVCRSDVNHNDKSKHDWGQSESGMSDIINRFTQPNQLICDPFCGGGATVIAAMEMDRRFVGCDINEAYVKGLEEIKASLVKKVEVLS